MLWRCITAALRACNNNIVLLKAVSSRAWASGSTRWSGRSAFGVRENMLLLLMLFVVAVVVVVAVPTENNKKKHCFIISSPLSRIVRTTLFRIWQSAEMRVIHLFPEGDGQTPAEREHAITIIMKNNNTKKSTW